MSKRIKNIEAVSEDPAAEPTGFNHLPYDCFHLIFRRISLHQLIILRRVCSIWNGHVQQLCHQKHSLKLILYTRNNDNDSCAPNVIRIEIEKELPEVPREMDLFYTDDLIQCVKDDRESRENRHDYLKIRMPSLTSLNITGLIQQFQSLTSLTIVFNCENNIRNVNRLDRLIANLSCPNLVHFSMWITKYKQEGTLPSDESNLLERLHQIVSQQSKHNLASVRKLELCYGIGGLDYLKNPRLELPEDFISKLEIISLDCYTDRILDEILCKLGPSLTDLSIDLRLIVQGLDGWAEKLEKSPIAKSVTHLRLFLEDEKQFQVFAQVFREVKNLQIGCTDKISLTPSWITTLSTLPHLSTLRLHRFKLVHPPKTTSKLLQPTIQSLPSVKHLTLYCSVLNHKHMLRFAMRKPAIGKHWNRFCATLSGHFPQVEQLAIVTDEPTYNDFNEEPNILNDILESKCYFKELKKYFTEFKEFDLL